MRPLSRHTSGASLRLLCRRQWSPKGPEAQRVCRHHCTPREACRARDFGAISRYVQRCQRLRSAVPRPPHACAAGLREEREREINLASCRPGLATKSQARPCPMSVARLTCGSRVGTCSASRPLWDEPGQLWLIRGQICSIRGQLWLLRGLIPSSRCQIWPIRVLHSRSEAKNGRSAAKLCFELKIGRSGAHFGRSDARFGRSVAKVGLAEVAPESAH